MKNGSQAVPNHLLTEERLRHHWTQQEVADRIGTTSTNYSRWERGVTTPGPYFRFQLCDLFAKSARELGLQQERMETAPQSHELYDPLIPIYQPLVGREALLGELKHRLCAGQEMAHVALHGLPGAGKTALAVALACDEKVREYFCGGILWAGPGPQPNLFGLLSRWGSLLKVTSMERLNSVDAWAVALRTAIGQRRMLLVLDDVWPIEDALALKVGGANCAYLITSRFADTAFHFTVEGEVAVHELDEDQGLDLLAKFAPQVVEAEPEAARRLVRSVGGLPLALTLIGKHLQFHTKMQPRRLQTALERLRQTEERFRLHLPVAPLERSPHLPSGTSLSLQSSIAVSVQHLDEEVRTALYTLAVFPPKPNTFSEEAALSVIDTDPDILDRLNDVGLVESSGPGRYMLHQTIVDYARLVHSDADAEKRLVEYMIGYVERCEKDQDALEQEYVNICAALDSASGRNMQALLVRGVRAFEPFLQRRGMYPLADLYLKRAQEAARSLGDAEALAQLLFYQGRIARWLGEYQRAEECLQEGLQVARRHCLSHQQTLLLSDLGWLALGRGQYSEAEAYFQEGLPLARQSGNYKSMDTMLNGLAGVCYKRGNFVQAEALCLEALAAARQVGQHSGALAILLNLRFIAVAMGHHDKAATYLQEALELARRVNHPDQVGILMNLGESMIEQDNYSQAQIYLQEALALTRQTGDQDRQSNLLLKIGKALLEQRQYAQAETYLQEALSITRQMGQQERTGDCLVVLGDAATRKGFFAQAEIYLQEGLALARQLGHAQLLCSMLRAWGELALKRQQIEIAAATFEEMQAVIPQGAQEHMAQAEYGLARVYAAKGDIDQARQRGETSLGLFEAVKHHQANDVREFLKALPVQEADHRG
ncbi:MAG TPA: tetratricopeptide repeat protein [Ktedonobacteraceae bacterium]|nr:tetratricopeptide repeat protein [Ktedonobacteraceae bacterium]